MHTSNKFCSSGRSRVLSKFKPQYCDLYWDCHISTLLVARDIPISLLFGKIFETEEEKRKRLEREAAERGNTEVMSHQVKTYADGSQEHHRTLGFAHVC